jgi:adenosylcobyric acid synthase
VGLDEALARALSRRSTLLGICAGYQMLGVEIHDEVESRAGTVPGLGLLDVVTTFEEEKVTRRVVGRSSSGEPVVGYEIRHGRPVPRPGVPAWLVTDGQPAGEGVADEARGIYATSVHGLFEADELRHRFLAAVAARRGRPLGPSSVRFAALREARIDRLADALEEHLELEAVLALLGEGAGGR